MTKIKILPEILSNKIAAGEIVERPASVVKELIENALDAGSAKIITEIERGGRSLVRVSDDGIGMGRDDALLALERYATSKIYDDKDLFSIRTLGFRGEALPSIASVSRFSLETRNETEQAGTRIDVEGGKIKKVAEIGVPVGTMITVKQLFFNTPARRKFLKTINTEMGHILDTLTSLALGWPGVRFVIYHDGKLLKDWFSASDSALRVADVLGKELADDLKPVRYSDAGLSVSGWLSSPRGARSTSRKIYTFINGRFVRDRAIQHALLEGYSGRLMRGQFPVAVLYMDIPFDGVDVNVHPTKHAVRFLEHGRVYDTIKAAVAKTIKITDRSGWAGPTTPVPGIPVISEPWSGFVRSAQIAPEPNQKTVPQIFRAPAKQTELWDRKRFGDLRVIGQHHNTYIVCESAEGIILVDQHAAHERILFERLKNRQAKGKKASQGLLIPETIELGYREADVLEKMITDLQNLGLDIEPFGGNTFVVKSVPSLLANREIKPLITEIAEKMIVDGLAPGLEETIDRCLILMACHGAIRANQRLHDEQIKDLLNQLDACDNPSNCPHGRPTWIEWNNRFLEKSFNRIV